jgi:DNA polymerase-4
MTFDRDIEDFPTLEIRLWQACERASARLKEKGLLGGSLRLKLRSADFSMITRQTRLPSPESGAPSLFSAALPMLRESAGGRAWRLIGIAVADLRLEASHSQGDLFAATQARRLAQDAAIDSIRERFGPQSIIRGRSLRLPQD